VNRIDLVQHDRSALEPGSALATFEAFLGKHFPDPATSVVLVGHNVGFDRGFLAAFFAHQSHPLEPRISHRIIDTHSIAAALRDAGRLAVGNLSSSALFDHFGIQIPEDKRHTALGDALGTFELYWKLVELMK
jgi:DNA polymerase-3 subunit epsilon